ncbi:hypothetical protein K4H28_13540 [Deefgea tanakiae]|uniref:Uncharacterized protein n=1 Tax=Deefgea tanakiae TaxID=2865840 RepID=A0ABX8Z809_9NEIS|nr:hypothetical protein [Deefgea tanakiae]QZA77295.1 hypothetical protein K4H28_13540 [Deefgea tanakiae]
MQEVNISDYRNFLISQLESLIEKDSFAWLVKEQLGEMLSYSLEEWGDDARTEFFNFWPSESLYLLILGEWQLDFEWLANKDGTYSDDGGLEIDDSVDIKLNGIEHLAAYGLWLAKSRLDDFEVVSSAEDGLNRDDLTIERILNYQLARYLESSKALTYALTLKSGLLPSAEQLEKAAISRLARKAAEKKHSAPNGSRAKRAEIRELWLSGKYSTRDQCAEQECGALGVLFSKARKDLRNTPDPINWPAKPIKLS